MPPTTKPIRIRIRPITAEDLPAVEALVLAVFQAASIDNQIQARFGGAPWERVKGAVVRRQAEAGLQSGDNGCFVAVSGQRIVGYISTAVNHEASRGCICDLAVAADSQGQGLGAKLIQHALKFFRRMKLHQVKIETLETNLAGQHLYPKLGFVEVARQIHYAMPLGARQLLTAKVRSGTIAPCLPSTQSSRDCKRSAPSVR